MINKNIIEEIMDRPELFELYIDKRVSTEIYTKTTHNYLEENDTLLNSLIKKFTLIDEISIKNNIYKFIDKKNDFDYVDSYQLVMMITLYYSIKYYQSDNPLISDAQFDKLIAALQEYEDSNPQDKPYNSLTERVGGFANRAFTSVMHKTPLLSLDKAFSKETLEKFDNTVKKLCETSYIEYIVEPKIDGLSVAIEYSKGRLFRASTRGDGEFGEDITHNIKTISELPHKISNQSEYFEIRAEVYMSNTNFDLMVAAQKAEGSDISKNPRNAAAGSLRQLDSKIVKARNLQLFAYDILNDSEKTYATYNDMLDELKLCKIPTVEAFGILDNIEDAYNKIIKTENSRGTYPYDIDGAVLKVNNIHYHEILGAVSHHPKWAIAYKFKHEEAETTVKDIELTVGRTGLIVPTAVLEPVFLGGSTISRASLHNFNYIKEKDIRINDTVKIKKAGEIIPQIVTVVSHCEQSVLFLEPEICPSCSNPVKFNDSTHTELLCSNINCPAQIMGRLVYFVSKDAMDIDGLGESMIQKLIENNKISNFADIYELQLDDFLNIEKSGKKTGENILNSIERSKRNPLYKLVSAIGIKGVGINNAKLLCDKFEDIELLMAAEEQQLTEIDGLGLIVAQNITSFFASEENTDLINKLKKYGCNMQAEKVEKTTGYFTDKKVAISGTFENFGRKKLQNLLIDQQAKISSIVNKKTDYLLLGQNGGSKVDKANECKVKIIEEEELLSLLNV